LAGLLLTAFVAAWLYVTSDAGAERVRGEVLRVLRNSLAGRFEAKHLGLKGGVIRSRGREALHAGRRARRRDSPRGARRVAVANCWARTWWFAARGWKAFTCFWCTTGGA